MTPLAPGEPEVWPEDPLCLKICYPQAGMRLTRMRWGERLEYVADASPGDFIYVPPFVPHQEINASSEEPLSCLLVRSGLEPVVVNLEIAPAEPPEEVYWVDDIHSSPS